MRRSQLVFVSVVFTALCTGIVVERTGRNDSFADLEFTPRRIRLDPVEVPMGEYVLTGRVLDPAGSPAGDVRVHLWSEVPPSGTADPLYGDATDDEGRFTIEGLEAGTYHVALLQIGYPNTLSTVTIPAPSGMEWTLDPPLPPLPALPVIQRRDLEGRLSPPVGILSAAWPLEDYEIFLEPAEHENPLGGAVQRRALCDAEGDFRFAGLVEADYRVRVLPPWAAGGSWPVLDDVEYSHGAEADPDPGLALRLRAGELAGTLVDRAGKAVEGVLVTLWPEGEENRRWPPLQTDARGEFVIRDLPPGPYVVRVQAGTARAEQRVAVRIGVRTEVPWDPLRLHGDH